MKNRLYL